MSKIACREIYFVDATRSRSIDFLIDKVKEAVEKLELSQEYDVRIYKNIHSCCGVGGLSVVIEIAGPKEERIREIDLRAISKILEHCEREGCEVGHHIIQQYEEI
ncbi:hypothetical protein MUO79_11830 [Candidatus Bathyarchaeota archaeon]|jgi:hypothetical protein|nr:hypothetical protein [Candidatus Bathyarchaeota archaeon]